MDVPDARKQNSKPKKDEKQLNLHHGSPKRLKSYLWGIRSTQAKAYR